MTHEGQTIHISLGDEGFVYSTRNGKNFLSVELKVN